MKTVYLDHAATTPLRREVVNAMYPHLVETYGNPSSLHERGRRARAVLEAARGQVAILLGVHPGEVVFTGSGTEANNLAVVGAARAARGEGRHVLISQIEHPSILAAGERLREDGFAVEYVPVDGEGFVDASALLRMVQSDTTLVSVMYANNEIGVVEPIREIAAGLRERFGGERGPLFHTDACQASGQLPLSPSHLGVDLMTINGSKVYGPKGIGALYVRAGVRIEPQVVGGHQELGRRAGTENVALAVGFAAALDIALRSETTMRGRLTALRDHLIRRIEERVPGAVLNGPRDRRLPNNVHFSIPHIEGESLLLLLDRDGISASTGSACSSHNLAPSHVLRAIGQEDELIHGSIRLTLGEENTEDDIEYAADALARSVERLKKISPLPLSL